MKKFVDYKSSFEYNSYLFGNSKCNVFKSENWIKYLNEEIEMVNLASPGERIFNIFNKLDYIEQCQLDIDNVLIVLDKKVLVNFDGNKLKGPVYVHHSISENNTPIHTHFKGFEFYSQGNFYIKYLSKMLGYVSDYNKEVSFLGDYNMDNLDKPQSLETNFYSNMDSSIDINLIGHSKKKFFLDTTLKTISTRLVKSDSLYLQKIAEIFDRNNTDYKIVFGPFLNENPISKIVLAKFNNIFGKDNVYDFSSHPKYTNKPQYWYDKDHYRTSVANEMLANIYREK